MHLAPLTGIETSLKALNQLEMLMHLAPLTGIETPRFYFRFCRKVRCISRPLRGLKLGII